MDFYRFFISHNSSSEIYILFDLFYIIHYIQVDINDQEGVLQVKLKLDLNELISTFIFSIKY